ncbi:peptidoglycan DD-metalloendopeptidase family protein [Burkholderia vietnamiensis]|uniref:peptidoglycan DD-metalloendopeptidase family protein n=1 Tax=Burkholderia vietnamiensis TaxID=60552 RepID=UPI001B95F34C|nr:peptidoglycan DD-metalloendopeptidase family protein [Burkholderia vietnamiensis]MBR8359256.1 peptidoglycan DD-metalloendopeptidase family protein [Burkholderia vietnamiensis]
MRETIPIHEALTRWLPQAALVVAAAALSGCTMTPWTDSWQPMRSSTPTSAATPGVIAGYYRVNPGDTLASVAAAYGQRVQDVASWNHMSPNDALSPGQVLRVAPPPAATSLTQAPSTSAQPGSLAWPATGIVATPFSAGKTRGIVIAASGPDHSVRAAANGRVVYAGTGVKAYGPLVILKHDNGLITAYGHNGKLLVNEGDAVRTGQPIAEMGTDPSGRATFEFEVRQNGKVADPMNFLARNGG